MVIDTHFVDLGYQLDSAGEIELCEDDECQGGLATLACLSMQAKRTSYQRNSHCCTINTNVSANQSHAQIYIHFSTINKSRT